jgi:hypothetical protein
MSSLSDHAAYREAKAAVGDHRAKQAAAELAVHAYLKSKRGVPPHLLYGDDGEPIDRTLAALTAERDKATADVRWCQALVVACGEVVKGCTFEEATKSKIDLILDRIDEGLAD